MRLLLTILFTVVAPQLIAEPSTAVRILMDRPLSIFDWGMFKLEQRLERLEVPSYVSYHWDDNKITISTFSYKRGVSSTTMEETKTDCEKVFLEYDDILWIKNGADRHKGNCIFCEYFSHNGWTNDTITKAREDMKDRLYYRYDDISNRCERKAYGTSVSISPF